MRMKKVSHKVSFTRDTGPEFSPGVIEKKTNFHVMYLAHLLHLQ